MGKNKDNITADGVVKGNNSKLPLLVFLIGLFLIVAGFLMQIGWFGESEPVPAKPAKEQSEEAEVNNDNNENAAIEVTKDNAFTLNVGSTYSFESGELILNAVNIVSTCDTATNVCGMPTDIVELNVTDKDGNTTSVQLNQTNLQATVGTNIIKVDKWGNGEVDLIISSTESTGTDSNQVNSNQVVPNQTNSTTQNQ